MVSVGCPQSNWLTSCPRRSFSISNSEFGDCVSPALCDMRFPEQAAEAGFVLGRLIEGCEESLPLFAVEHESGLFGQSLLGLLAGATHDEVCNADALPFGCNLDEGFFGSSSAKLETPVPGCVRCRDRSLSAPVHCTPLCVTKSHRN